MNYLTPVIDRLTDLLDDCPAELIDLYSLLVVTKGKQTTLEDVHEAWGIWKNRIKPDHKSLVPFNELTFEVQELDRKYMEAIHEASNLIIK